VSSLQQTINTDLQAPPLDNAKAPQRRLERAHSGLGAPTWLTNAEVFLTKRSRPTSKRRSRRRKGGVSVTHSREHTFFTTIVAVAAQLVEIVKEAAEVNPRSPKP
jgi:hypothetical protein